MTSDEVLGGTEIKTRRAYASVQGCAESEALTSAPFTTRQIRVRILMENDETLELEAGSSLVYGYSATSFITDE